MPDYANQVHNLVMIGEVLVFPLAVKKPVVNCTAQYEKHQRVKVVRCALTSERCCSQYQDLGKNRREIGVFERAGNTKKTCPKNVHHQALL